LASQQPAGGDFDNAAAVVFDSAPAGGSICFRQRGDVARLAAHDRQTIEVAAVFRAQGGDEGRLPTRRKTIPGVQSAQAGEKSIDNPELILSPRFACDPGRFVCLNVIDEMGGAREKAGVMLPLELGRYIRRVAQEPHFLARTNGDGSRLDADAHGALKLVESQSEATLPRGDYHQMPGLIGGDENRQAQLR